ncbi:MAG: SAVED domain-containing protein [Planctomycetes bacterium]|nr:SAVED domain-containing protein [Planctomycetota bacterium]
MIPGTGCLVADQINLTVEEVRERISSALTKTGAGVVHLFLAEPGPSPLFLGHRLNATCSIQCYEDIGPAKYVPAFRLPCTWRESSAAFDSLEKQPRRIDRAEHGPRGP